MLTLAQYIDRQFADVSKEHFKSDSLVFQGCNFLLRMPQLSKHPRGPFLRRAQLGPIELRARKYAIALAN